MIVEIRARECKGQNFKGRSTRGNGPGKNQGGSMIERQGWRGSSNGKGGKPARSRSGRRR